MHRSKLTIVLTFTLLILIALMGVPTAGAAPDKGSTTDSTVLNIGHRGASGYAPEHTIPAYDLALEQGADYIEIDLQMTADGVLVAMHDDTLDRTATAPEGVPEEYCTGLVIEKTLEQIKQCDVGSWFGPEYAGEQIPTLEEIFQRYGTSVNYYIETKNPEAAPGMEEELLQADGGVRPDRAGRRALAGPDPVLQRGEPHDDPRDELGAAPDPALLQLGDKRDDPGSNSRREHLRRRHRTLADVT